MNKVHPWFVKLCKTSPLLAKTLLRVFLVVFYIVGAPIEFVYNLSYEIWKASRKISWKNVVKPFTNFKDNWDWCGDNVDWIKETK